MELTATGLDTIEGAKLREAASEVQNVLRETGEGGSVAPADFQPSEGVRLTWTDAAGDQFDITVGETSCRIRATDWDVSVGDIDFIGRRNPYSTDTLTEHLKGVRRGVAAGRTWDAITAERTDDVKFIGMQAWPDRGRARVETIAVIDGHEYTLTTAGYEPPSVNGVDVILDGNRLPQILRHAVLQRTGESLGAPRGHCLEHAAATMAAWARAVTHDPAWRP